MRTLINSDPFLDLSKFWAERARWPAQWITHPQANGSAAVVQAFRRQFTLEKPLQCRIHVSADERYELWLDGQRIGRGPERGDRFNWFFETYDLQLKAGEHTLVARSWWLNEFGPAPFAQISIRPAFLLAGEGAAGELLSTGVAAWECKWIQGCYCVDKSMAWGTGAKLRVAGSEFSWDWENGGGTGWEKPKAIGFAYGPQQLTDQPPYWILKPATLPAMLESEVFVGTARHVQKLNEMPTGEMVVLAKDHLAKEAQKWDDLLQKKKKLTIPAKTIRRVIIDLGNYYTAYPDLITSGGKGSVLRVWWAESLYEKSTEANSYGSGRVKGNRDEIDGKFFVGIGDTFEPDGGKRRVFNTLWWEAGRYIELIVSTGDVPLTIEQFSLRETHYPYEWAGRFEASDERLGQVIPIAKRVLEMCSHETYMDCPYYEQLMYVGDTRLEVLSTYTWCADDRLPRKALRMFDESRKSPGFTQSRYPSRIQQTIPPFSLWWVGMVHDYMMWRGDRAVVAALLPGVRAVLDTFDRWKNADGLVAGPPGWNYQDWVPSWQYGMPVNADCGISGILNLQLAWVSRQAAELECYVGEREMAKRFRRHARDYSQACQAFWDKPRNLYADDLDKQHFSEHAQCLAILGDIDIANKQKRLLNGLLSAPDLARTTIYYSHYLFEVFAKFGHTDKLIERMGLWFDHPKNGLKTTMEGPEPTRSDCHAWGAHPIYHYLASLLGIRPDDPGFQTVKIRPQPGPLASLRGSMVHPRGLIAVEVNQRDGRISGSVRLPEGLTGTVQVHNDIQALKPGLNRF